MARGALAGDLAGSEGRDPGMEIDMNVHVQRAAALVAGVWVIGAGAWLGMAAAHADPFDQRDFPCQEDEYLGYSPAFGPDRVGCIHIDDLATSRLGEWAIDAGANVAGAN